ncbi:unnamed protein product [Citrullus colocynthis]|uniref:Uncharacterized protein n=1 Tax=Citrullus colocynthis TaxID=252529 RepID=A0ABP0YW68_9ROSI
MEKQGEIRVYSGRAEKKSEEITLCKDWADMGLGDPTFGCVRPKVLKITLSTSLDFHHHHNNNNQSILFSSTTSSTSLLPSITMPSWLSYAVAWIATLALLLLSRRLRRRKLNLPPGPKPWPLIGNLDLIGSLPHQSIHQLSKKYGPIMHLRFGSFPVVVGSSVEMAKIILKTHDLNFVSRPKTAAGKYTTYNYSDITWSQYGPYWRQARKMCLMELFSARRLDSYEYIRKEEMNALLKDIYNSCGEVMKLKDHLSTVSLNVISRMVLGKKYTDESENAIVSPDEFKKMLDELFLLSGVLNIGDSIPWIDFLDLQGYVKRMKALSKKFDRFLEHVLDEHNERRKGVKDYVAKDMVDVLLQLADDPDLEVKLERHGVKAFTQVSCFPF